MKTQINNIICGKENVRIDANNSKYTTAKKSTQHTGFAGTNMDDRRELFAIVENENGDAMYIELFGFNISLSRKKSCSGNTMCYSSPISTEQYEVIAGHSLGVGKNDATIMISPSLEVSVSCGNYTQHIGTEFITIK